MDRFEITALLGRQRRFHQQADHGHDAVHRGADLMAHRREEFRFGAGAGFGRQARGVQLALLGNHAVEPLLGPQRRAHARLEDRRFHRFIRAIQHAQRIGVQFALHVIGRRQGMD